MRDYVAQLESKFSNLMAVVSGLEESMKVAIWVSSWTEKYIYSLIVASANSALEDEATWSCMSTVFLEEQKTLKVMAETLNNLTQSDEIGQAAGVIKHTRS